MYIAAEDEMFRLEDAATSTVGCGLWHPDASYTLCSCYNFQYVEYRESFNRSRHG